MDCLVQGASVLTLWLTVMTVQLYMAHKPLQKTSIVSYKYEEIQQLFLDEWLQRFCMTG